MSRRLEIEITSLNGHVATWRAAGAKLPKGVLDVSLVPGEATVGTTYRAEIEQFMEGIEVLAVIPAKTASPLDPRNERVERITDVPKGPDVVVTYAPKGRGPRRDDGARPGPRKPSTARAKGPGTKERTRPSRPARTGEGAETPPRRPRSDRAASGPRAERSERPSRAGSHERPSSGERTPRPPRSDRSPRGERHERTSRARPTAPPLTTAHRNALLATLSPEQLPVAEQLLRGGMPAVRAAVAEQNTSAASQGRPAVDPTTIERIADDLLSKTTLAMWKDRAGGAISAGRELRLRDLRAVVTSAKTASLDDEARAQLKELQGALSARVDHLRTQWNEKLNAAIGANNVREALALVARPPDLSTRVSADAAGRVVALVSASLSAEQSPALWNEIVELAADTAIRRNVKPLGIPNDESSRAVAVHNAGAIPELAKLLGMRVPPPPPPTRLIRRGPTRRAS